METYQTIKERLDKKVQQQLQHSTEQLDHQQQLFLDWTAWELGKLHQDLGESRTYIEKNIVEKLSTEKENRPRPVHALAKAMPKKHGQKLLPEGTPFTMQRMVGRPPYEIYFTPVRRTILVNAKVRFYARGNQLFEVKESEQNIVLTSQNGFAFHQGVLWWGIEVGTDFDPKDDLHFYINWEGVSEEKKEKLYATLPLVQWYANGQKLKTEIGRGNWLGMNEEENNRQIDAEYLWMHQIETDILKEYENCFVGLTNNQDWLDKHVDANGIPLEIKQQFEEVTLKELGAQKMIWLKMVFPASFSAVEVEQTQIQLNCFPILNRKLDKSKDRSPSSSDFLEIIPLSNAETHRGSLADTHDCFLGIQKIVSENRGAYQAITFEDFQGDFYNIPQGYYALQLGKVEADDIRDLQAQTATLVALLRHKSSQMKKVVPNSLESALSDIENGAATLANVMNQQPHIDKVQGYYLHIKLLDNQQMIFVRFWVTQGEVAEAILKRGDYLQREGGFEAEVINLI